MSSGKAAAAAKATSAGDISEELLLTPIPSHDEVIQVVKAHFCSSPDTPVQIKKALESYDDANFWVTIGDDTDYLVKVHNGVDSKDAIKSKDGDSAIHFQYAVMKALKEQGIPASCPILTKGSTNDNNSLVTVPLPVKSKEHSPCLLIVSVYTWVKGTPMSELPVLPIESLADAGRFLGKLRLALDKAFPDTKTVPPAAKRKHQWDGQHFHELKVLVPHITDPKRKAMFQSLLTAFDTQLLQSGVAKKLRTSVNHADFNDANIILNTETFQVAGVIDFGDSVESWTVLEVSVAMAYAMTCAYGQGGRAISAAAALLRGFHAVYPLTDQERELLPLLVACRLACTAAMGTYSSAQNPENKYLQFHAEPCWQTLEHVWGGSADDTERRVNMAKAMKHWFDRACAKSGVSGDDDSTTGVIDCADLTVCDEFLLENLPTASTEQPRKRQKVANDDQSNASNQKVITFVTGNKKKLEEVKRILFDDDSAQKSNFTLTNRKIDLPELQGDPLDIAKEKCEEAARTINGPVITEDTSLCFMALKELPGPYIKWFLDKCGHDGLNKMIAGYDDKSAYAQTVVAYCEGPGKEVLTFDGRTMGKVVPARGKLDFGWDPIFEPDEGGGKTYAEMTKDEKDAISHRSRAFGKLKAYLLLSS